MARELALFKISADGDSRAQIMEYADIFRGRIVDVSKRSVTVEVTGADDKIEAFEQMCRPFGLIEMVRTGEIAVSPRPLGHLSRPCSCDGALAAPGQARAAARRRGGVPLLRAHVVGVRARVEPAGRDLPRLRVRTSATGRCGSTCASVWSWGSEPLRLLHFAPEYALRGPIEALDADRLRDRRPGPGRRGRAAGHHRACPSRTARSTRSSAATCWSTCPTTARRCRSWRACCGREDGCWCWSRSTWTATRTHEDPAVRTPEDREREFLQHDHVRLYAPDIVDRLDGGRPRRVQADAGGGRPARGVGRQARAACADETCVPLHAFRHPCDMSTRALAGRRAVRARPPGRGQRSSGESDDARGARAPPGRVGGGRRSPSRSIPSVDLSAAVLASRRPSDRYVLHRAARARRPRGLRARAPRSRCTAAGHRPLRRASRPRRAS